MALQTEDASTVLEQFIQDVANLPAEIAHLLEEVQAKDDLQSQCRTKIHELDIALQKHVKLKGASVKHDREEAILQTVNAQFDRAQALQDEKVALSNKAAFLLDRHVKRLDLKIRDLQTDGAMGVDPSLPSLLHESHANRVGINSASNTGTSTPIHPLAQASGSSTNVANAAMAQMLNRVAHQNNMGSSAPAAAMQPHPMLNNNGTNGTQRRRDVSAGGASDTKRRRLNATIPMPNAATNLQQRHSSLGPGTPKASTPTASRAGSAGPRTKKAAKKVPPHVQSSMRKKHGKMGLSKSNARRLMSNKKGTPSSTGDDDSADEESGSDDDESSAAAGKDGAADEDEMDVVVQEDDADDSKLYCFCKSVSHGDMVACDNEDCPHEWFHWECVGLTQEPKGRWLCEHCRKLPQSRIKLAR